MITALIRLDLRGPVVLSSSAATSGLHQSYRFIHGSRLLGAVASKFDWTDKEKGFKLFRSGQIVFGNAYPVLNGKRCFPAPRSLHKPKTQTEDINWTDLSCDEWKPETPDQPKQARTEFFSTDRLLAEETVETGYTLKSAHDMASGTSKEAQLFGYEYLKEGQSFVAEIKAETHDDLDFILEKLGNKIRLGRSKASQFGDVGITRLDHKANPNREIKSDQPISLWAVSDVYFLDTNGIPKLRPTASDFGIENAEIDWNNSYVWRKTFTPYNAALGAREIERAGFGAGSVFRFEPQNKSFVIPKKVFDQGVGAFRETGAGQLRLMPSADQIPLAVSNPVSAIEVRGSVDTGLVKILKERKAREEQKRLTIDYVASKPVMALVSKIWKLKNDQKPSTSQWRQVLDVTLSQPSEKIIHLLYVKKDKGENKAPFCLNDDKGWKEVGVPFKKLLEKAIEDELDVALFVRRLIARLTEDRHE